MLIFTTPDKIKKAKGFFKAQEYSWVYFGSNICLKQRTGVVLSEARRYQYAAELNEVVDCHKADFIDWMSKIGAAEPDKINWFSSLTASRSPIQNDLFLLCCYFLLSARWIRQDVTRRLVVVENPWLLEDIRGNFKKSGAVMLLSRKYMLKARSRKILKKYLKSVLFIGNNLKLIVAVGFLKIIRSQKIKRRFSSGFNVIIYSWIEDRCFRGGQFNDPYLGSLEQLCRDNGYKAARLTPISFPVRLIKKIFDTDSVIVPLPAFITVKNIFKAALAKLRIKDIGPFASGYNLSNLLNFMSIEEDSSEVLNRNLLTHHALSAALRSIRILPPAVFIYPFENQGWEKVALACIKECGKFSKSIACQIAAIAPNDVSYYLGDREKSFTLIPDSILASSDYYVELLKNMGQVSAILNAGSLRFKGAKPVYSCGPINNNWLVLLSVTLSYSLELIYFAASKLKNKDNLVFLKTHPDLPEKILRRYIKDLPDNFYFTSENLSGALGRADFVLYSATTAALECLEAAKSVYKFRPELIDIDPASGLNLSIPEINFLNADDIYRPQAKNGPAGNISIFDKLNIDVWLGAIKEGAC